MATLLDVSLLDYFTSFFIFIFVWVFFYAILTKLKFLSEKSGINALISACVAVLVLVTSSVVNFIKVLTPWFFVLLFVFFCFIMIFMLFGIKLEDIAKQMGSSGNVWTIIIVLIILLIIAIAQVFGPAIAGVTQGEEPSGASFLHNIGVIVFSPKVLGMFFLMLLAAQTVRLIGSGF